VFTRHFTRGRGVEAAGSPTSEETARLSAEIEARDTTIAALERTLAEHEAQIATLTHALEQEAFRTRILEQSYATQLAEARERAASAERLDGEQRARIAELEKSHAALTRQLAEARPTRDPSGPDAVSIDELLASFAAPRARLRADDPDAVPAVPTDRDSAEEMLPPQVMLAGKKTEQR
jgi:hypothetical protein